MGRTDITISPYGRGACPVCGREFNLTKAGVVRTHLAKTDGGRPVYCYGSRRAPGGADPSGNSPTRR